MVVAVRLGGTVHSNKEGQIKSKIVLLQGLKRKNTIYYMYFPFVAVTTLVGCTLLKTKRHCNNKLGTRNMSTTEVIRRWLVFT